MEFLMSYIKPELIIVAIALCVPVVTERIQRRRAYSKGGEQ